MRYCAPRWQFLLTGASNADRMPDLRHHLGERLGIEPAVEMLIREIQSEESNCRGQKDSHGRQCGGDSLSLP